MIDLTKSCLDSISHLAEHLEGALVYLDSGCTESFQFIGAFPLLLDYGACAVCSLENMSPLDATANWNSHSEAVVKIVVITSCLLSDSHRYILRCLTSHEGVRRCTIFTSISEISHSSYHESPLGPDAFREYGSLLLQDYEELVKKCESKSSTFGDDDWSQFASTEEDNTQHKASINGIDFYEDDLRKELVISVHHFPMILCPFSPGVFLLPSEGSVAEACLSFEHENSLSPGLPPISTGVSTDGDDIPPGGLLTAHFLYHLATKMDLKMEIFSLGDLSNTVGKIMTDMSSLYDVGRRKRSAGLLLVDRTLDLLTPCCHGDSLVDRMFSALPRRKRTISYSHHKGLQVEVKFGASKVQRAPLDVEIPLASLLKEEDCTVNDNRLLEGIGAFLLGWDINKCASQIPDIHLDNRVHDEQFILSNIRLLNGSFISTEEFNGTPYMEAILDKRAKDGALLVKKWLQETLHKEGITSNFKNRPGFVTKSELLLMIKEIAKSQSLLIKHKGIIQLAAAVVVALDELQCARWEAFISAEKILSISAGDTCQSLSAQIGDLLNRSVFASSNGQRNGKEKCSQAVISFQDALLLTIIGYILAGENFPTAGSGSPFSWQEEHFLKEAVVDAVLEVPSMEKLKFLNCLKEELESNFNRTRMGKIDEVALGKLDIDDFDDDQWGKWGTEDDEDDSTVSNKDKSYDDMQLKLELRDRVDNVFKFLHKLSALKTRDIPFRDGTFSLEGNFTGDPDSNKGLLYKLLTKLLNKHDIPHIKYHSSTVGRLFKSGFGRFGLGQAKPSLADHNVIMIFVLGGINGTEVREAQEALSRSGRPDTELILGGTTFLTPDDMLDLLLGHSSNLGN
ncbi:hypothetical protein K2173_022635 [Erythroxylum novogranatense]|uniref:Sec1 family domain-containing protein MIP3 n=1 Tax=Erythroxylum novogranatense TaxID=1862640 RepID=A0AAV8STQ6_9ROSI|nr:hypothetical protein K2173_022635 [Erythroxylum novogranatense]